MRGCVKTADAGILILSCGKAKFIATRHAAHGGSCLGGGGIRIVHAQRAMFC